MTTVPRPLRMLDLFSGLGGWAGAWRDAGHEVITVDLDPRFKTDIVGDVAQLRPEDLPWRPDVILASPPCEAFSVMVIGRNWHHDGTPKNEKSALAVELVRATMRLIDVLAPAYWIMENPVGKLRVLPVVSELERRTVTFCQYGETRMKPTDLWGGFPPSLWLRPPCSQGSPCHVAAPRGSRGAGTTQGMKNAALRAEIPRELSAHVLEACLRDVVR